MHQTKLAESMNIQWTQHITISWVNIIAKQAHEKAKQSHSMGVIIKMHRCLTMDKSLIPECILQTHSNSNWSVKLSKIKESWQIKILLASVKNWRIQNLFTFVVCAWWGQSVILYVDKYCHVSKLCMYTSASVSPWDLVLAHKQAMQEKILDNLHILILQVMLKYLSNLLVQSKWIYIFEARFQMQSKCLCFYFLFKWGNFQGADHRRVYGVCQVCLGTPYCLKIWYFVPHFLSFYF